MSVNPISSVAVFQLFRRVSFLLAACFILLCASRFKAQGVGSSRGLASADGIQTIQGRVYLPSGQSVGTMTVKVKLESASAFGVMSTVTDQDGAFRFNGLQAGSYTIVVDAGKEYETGREPVNIDREASVGGRIINVAIQLHPKVDASNPAFANVPQNAIDLYQKGMAAAKKGNAKSAVEFLSNAILIYPNFSVALRELGVQYLKLGEMAKLANTMDTLLRLTPNDAPAHLNFGIALFNQKKFADAETHLREAVRLANSDPAAHYYLGMTFVSVRKYKDAEKELELAISNGGDHLALAHRYLGGLYMGSKNPKAADELEKYLKLEPKAADAERIRATINELRSKQP